MLLWNSTYVRIYGQYKFDLMYFKIIKEKSQIGLVGRWKWIWEDLGEEDEYNQNAL